LPAADVAGWSLPDCDHRTAAGVSVVGGRGLRRNASYVFATSIRAPAATPVGRIAAGRRGDAPVLALDLRQCRTPGVHGPVSPVALAAVSTVRVPANAAGNVAVLAEPGRPLRRGRA